MGIGVACDFNLRKCEYFRSTQARRLQSPKFRNGVARDKTDRNRQVTKGFNRFDAYHIGRGGLQFAEAFDLGNVVPAIAVDMTEIHAPPKQRCDVRHWKAIIAECQLEEQERIDDPAHPVGRFVIVDRETIGDVAAAGTGHDQCRRRHAIDIGNTGREVHLRRGRRRLQNRELR